MQIQSFIQLHQVTYALPNQQILFDNLSLAFSRNKTGLLGRNGIGKTTLFKLIMNELQPLTGSIHCEGQLAYLPQNIQLPTHLTVAGFLELESILLAYQRILQGSTNEDDFVLLNDRWGIEQDFQTQLRLFNLNYLSASHKISDLSGGEFTRLLLTKAFHSNANMLLFDEPTNHLDIEGKLQFYEAVRNWPKGLLLISHDRELLNLMDEIVELTSLGAFHYGGNYDSYVEQKALIQAGYELLLTNAKKQVQRSKQSIQDSREKHASKRAYGRKQKESGSIDKLAANAARGKSERTQSRLLIQDKRLTREADTQLKMAKEHIETVEEINVLLPKTSVPCGKIILELNDVSFTYSNSANPLIQNFNLIMKGPERIALAGKNGIGITTLVRLILGQLQPQQGTVYIGTEYVCYLDQKASLLEPEASVLDNFIRLNPETTTEAAHTNLARFLFRNVAALKQVKHLSDGEKLRALLACILMATRPPQLMILDEPTNHLDLQSILSIESALKNYQGALIVISHDKQFISNIGTETIYTKFAHPPFITTLAVF